MYVIDSKATEGGKYIISGLRTSHFIEHKNLISCRFVGDSSQKTLIRLIQAKLVLLSNKFGIETYVMRTISRSSWWMNERNVCMR